MLIGQRLRQIRAQKGFSQGDLERASGLLRCYISRVENGHTVPSLETLEKLAGALAIPLYSIFLNDGELPTTPKLTPRPTLEELAEEFGDAGAQARFLLKLRSLAGRMAEADRALLLDFARKLASR